MASADVVFNITTEGADAAIQGITALTGAFVKLGKAVFEEVKEAQRFQQVVNALEVDMSGFTSATAGLIGTLESLQGANALSAAGFNATNEQMKALGKGAVDLGRALNKDATAVFTQLTEGIAKGSSRALKQFGIDLDDFVSESATLAEKQAVAVELLTAKFKDLNIEVETQEEKLYRLENAWGTIKAQMVSSMATGFFAWWDEGGDTIGGITERMEAMSEAIDATDGRMSQWMQTADGAEHSYKLMGNTIAYAVTKNEEYNNNLKQLDENLKTVTNQLINAKLAAETFANVGMGSGLAAVMASTQTRFKDAQKGVVNKKKEGPQQRKRGTGGGGGKKKLDAGMEFTMEESESGLDLGTLDLLSRETAADASGFGEFSPLDTNMFDDLRTRNEMLAEIENERWSAEKEAMRVHYDWVKQQEQKRKDETVQATSAVLNETAGVFGKLAALQNTQGKAGFERSKRLRIAQASATAPGTVMEAYARGMEVPGIGFVLGPIFAGVAGAFVAAQIAQISQSKYNGGGTRSPSVSTGGGNIGAFSGGLSSPAGGGDTIVNKIIVDGNVIHESLLNVVDAKSKQGQDTLARSV